MLEGQSLLKSCVRMPPLVPCRHRCRPAIEEYGLAWCLKRETLHLWHFPYGSALLTDHSAALKHRPQGRGRSQPGRYHEFPRRIDEPACNEKEQCHFVMRPNKRSLTSHVLESQVF